MLEHLKGRDASSGLEDWLRLQMDSSDRDTYDKNGSVPGYQLSLLAKEYIRQLARRRAVWCWLTAEGESAAMWSIYAPSGVGIGTTVDALSSSLPETRRFCASLIRYVDDQDLSSSSAVSPEDPRDEPWLFRPHFVKLLGYAHEHELRVSTRCRPGEAGVIVRKINSGSLIKKIMLSPVLPHSEAKAVDNCLKKLMPDSSLQIERSSLLAEIRMDEESDSSIRQLVANTLGDDGDEGNLPPLLNDL